jgi:hypothetical protein
MRVDKLPEIFPSRREAGSDRRPLPSVPLRGRRSPAGLMFIGLAFGAVFACFAQDRHPPAEHDGVAGSASQSPVSAAVESKPPAQVPENPSKRQKSEAAEGERKKQIADESTQLLAMALSLKAEVDKTNKDTLSLNVIRKADAIERLARTVKEKIRQSSGPS